MSAMAPPVAMTLDAARASYSSPRDTSPSAGALASQMLSTDAVSAESTMRRGLLSTRRPQPTGATATPERRDNPPEAPHLEGRGSPGSDGVAKVTGPDERGDGADHHETHFEVDTARPAILESMKSQQPVEHHVVDDREETERDKCTVEGRPRPGKLPRRPSGCVGPWRRTRPPWPPPRSLSVRDRLARGRAAAESQDVRQSRAHCFAPACGRALTNGRRCGHERHDDRMRRCHAP